MAAEVNHLAERIRERMDAVDQLDGTIAVVVGDETIFIDGHQSPAAVTPQAGDADCTVRMTADVLEEILDGERSGFSAFLSGEIAIDGDMSVAVQLRPLMSGE